MKHTGDYDEHATIRQWTLMGAFDTARECEDNAAIRHHHAEDKRLWVVSRSVPAKAVYPPKR